MNEIKAAHCPQDLERVVDVFREYFTSPQADLGFQDQEADFACLPGSCAAPDGCVLLAWQGDAVVGCAALRRIDEQTAEMKRVYGDPGLVARVWVAAW